MKVRDNTLVGSGLPSDRATSVTSNNRYNKLTAIDTVKIDERSRFTFTKKIKKLFPIEPDDIIEVYQDRENGQVLLNFQRSGTITNSWIVKRIDAGYINDMLDMVNVIPEIESNCEKKPELVEFQLRQVTFSLDKNLCNRLQIEAEKLKIRLNVLVNQVLKDYVEWNMFQPKIGLIPLAKPVVAEIFRKMSKEGVVDLAERMGRDAIKDVALFMTGKQDINSFLSWLELRFKKCGAEVSHTFENENNNDNHISHTYVVKHDIGENWALYNKVILQLIFNEVFDKQPDIQISPTMIVLKLIN